MAKQEKSTGFQASAGLIRYFDAEEKSAFHISPKAVIVVSVLTILGIYGLKLLVPVGG